MPLAEHQAITELLAEKDKQLQAALKVSNPCNEARDKKKTWRNLSNQNI